MSQVIREAMERQVYPFMEELFWRMAEKKDELVMDGVRVYNEKAQFVGGKVMNLCSFVVTELLDETKKEEGIRALREMIPMCAALPMQTWGIFNAVKGLYRMEKEGIRTLVVPGELWEQWKDVLDWRTFVDCEDHLALKGYPTNYYGVAFGIARYRELLGWEDGAFSEKLLERFMEHIAAFSGECECMDETPGDGRFDRYSILVPAEITNTVMDTGMALPDKIVRMLKKSAQISLFMANPHGYGFSYGRSTGAYGDTAALEILMAAMRVEGVLEEGEKRLAHAYLMAIIRRFGEFWIDTDMKSVNLWEKGRRTDTYRNKNRILSENLSLCMQLIETADWNGPECESGEEEAIWRQRAEEGLLGMLVPFAKGDHPRGLVMVRDESRVWSLPLISGGREYYETSPYLPIPYSQFAVTGVPEKRYALLVPQVVLADGTRAMPIVYLKDMKFCQEGKTVTVSCRQDVLCAVGEREMRPVEGIGCETVYTFSHGQIRRRDTFFVGEGADVTGVEMEALTFSCEPKETAYGVIFGKGVVREILQEGYESQDMRQAEDTEAFCTPEGKLSYHIRWEHTHLSKQGNGGADRGVIAVAWTLRYASSSVSFPASF